MKTYSFPTSDTEAHATGTLAWVVLDGSDPDDRAWLRSRGELDDGLGEVLWTPPSQNRRQHLDNAVLLSLVRLLESTDNDDRIGVNMLVEAEHAIVVCYGVRGLIEQALEKQVQRGGFCSTSMLLPTVVAALVKPLETDITRVTDDIDEYEDRAMGEATEGLNQLVVQSGRSVLGMRRYLEPMRDELMFLAFNLEELPGSTEARDLKRAADYLDRLIGLLEGSLNRVTLLLNQLRNRDEAHLARAMHKLTIVATVFLPLTFITGLLGINVAGIPDAHDPLAFWVVCGVLLGLALIVVILIRWRRWM